MQDKKPPSFLCVHQGFELYGSDRMFIHSLRAIKQAWPESPITAHLPKKGPISIEVSKYADQIVYGDLWVLRRADLSWRNWRKLMEVPMALINSWRLLRCHDVIYINTIVVFSYLFLVRFTRKPCFLHVHEFVRGAWGKMLYWLAKFSKANAIVNSNATAKLFPGIKAEVVLNCTCTMQDHRPMPHSTLNLLLLGRINRWKGHALTLEALKILHNRQFDHVRLRFMGSVFCDQSYYKHNLLSKVQQFHIDGLVEFIDFGDPQSSYEWADIVLVPSTDPEPFGLVAIEAMARKIPVIAARHGGLLDIVVNDQTGRLFTPSDAKDLADQIQFYIKNPDRLQIDGGHGYQRFLDLFQEKAYNDKLIGVIKRYVV